MKDDNMKVESQTRKHYRQLLRARRMRDGYYAQTESAADDRARSYAREQWRFYCSKFEHHAKVLGRAVELHAEQLRNG